MNMIVLTDKTTILTNIKIRISEAGSSSDYWMMLSNYHLYSFEVCINLQDCVQFEGCTWSQIAYLMLNAWLTGKNIE